MLRTYSSSLTLIVLLPPWLCFSILRANLKNRTARWNAYIFSLIYECWFIDSPIIISIFMAWSNERAQIVWLSSPDWILRNFSLAYMNLRPEIKLRATRKSASIRSYSNRFCANKKLVLMSAMTELPVGSRKVGQTNSLIDGNPSRKRSIVFLRLRFWSPPDSPLECVSAVPALF